MMATPDPDDRSVRLKDKIHTLFQYLLETTESAPEAIVGFSLSASPRLGDYLADLDPNLPLDWNGRDFRGLPELRDHVLAQAGLAGLCTPADVLITAGAAEANYLAIMQLLQPGERIVIETPGWPQAEVLAKAKGAEIVKVAREEAEGWRLPLDRLAAAVTPGTRMIFLTSPNNPTGALMTAAELSEVVAIAARVGAWLLVDEVYAGLEWTGPRAPAVAGLYDRGITTGSVSKALGLQGLRTGWLICRDAGLMRDALILRENSSEIMNILGEVIAEVALRPDRYTRALDRARADGAANLARMNAWVATQDRLSWVPPQAGLIGLARLADGIDSDAFARVLLAPPYRTFLLPGSAYDLPHHIRLGVGGGAGVRLEDGLDRLSRALRDWNGGA
jgi:aspartate/methionine/tyrosine aminotransferase